ncbi:MAG: carbohydrate binding domain-containing protein [Acidobacteriaceae bacterium]|nr:carbohydrate binding domain-containing protein [Acidobacteriaceae bacterium]
MSGCACTSRDWDCRTSDRGIGVERGAEYRFSAYIRSAGPKVIRASITDESGHEIGVGVHGKQ